ncbi:MAG: glutamine--fructose-6-phosphate aminotransferase, partial [Porticoccus sp.]|nr:glutamine--fructose-6-phosphate aminotransferase [Porticoccus sp.]
MCGIVGAVAQRNIVGVLIEGLRRLEYRGYDSSGLSFLDEKGDTCVYRNTGKVKNLANSLAASSASGFAGIAHTRWATHGVPSEVNAHPHQSSEVTVVHNGIIENHAELREEMQAQGYVFVSDTDTEAVAHLIHYYFSSLGSLKGAVQKTITRLQGAYALGVMCAREPGTLIGARSGSPLVLGLGVAENFIASDQMALRQVTDRFIFLEEGDLVELRDSSYHLIDILGETAERETVTISSADEIADKGEYDHYMLKEIFEQPKVLKAT